METVARPPSCPLPTRFAGTEARPHSCFRAAGVRLIREMPQGDLHAALKNCFAVVNSSVSEGMSAAILEVGTSPSPGTGAGRGPLLPALLGGGGVLVSRGPHFSQLQGAKQHSLGFSEAGLSPTRDLTPFPVSRPFVLASCKTKQNSVASLSR